MPASCPLMSSPLIRIFRLYRQTNSVKAHACSLIWAPADFRVSNFLRAVFLYFVRQLQLKQAIKLGSPPSLNCVKRTEDAGTMSEDDGLPCSPPEYTTTVALDIERHLTLWLAPRRRAALLTLFSPSTSPCLRIRLRGTAPSVWREQTAMTTR